MVACAGSATTTLGSAGASGTAGGAGQRPVCEGEAECTGGIGGSMSEADPGGTAGAAGDSAQSCEGDFTRPFDVPVPRMRTSLCYLAKKVNGEARCKPPSEVQQLVQPPNSSCGYAVEFVIDFAETVPVAATCAAAIECCDAVTNYRQKECLTSIANAERVDGAASCDPKRFETTYGCPAPDTSTDSAGAAGEAGVDANDYSLCCYETCTHIECI
jgi:hypothetical protein